MTTKARRSFYELVATFIGSPFFVHFDVKQQIKIKTEGFNYAISGILSQNQDSEWKAVAYYSQKMIDADRNYEIHDAELVNIVENFYY